MSAFSCASTRSSAPNSFGGRVAGCSSKAEKEIKLLHPARKVTRNHFPPHNGKFGFQTSKGLVRCFVGLAPLRVIIETPNGAHSWRAGIKPSLLLAVEDTHLPLVGPVGEAVQIALWKHVI